MSIWYALEGCKIEIHFLYTVNFNEYIGCSKINRNCFTYFINQYVEHISLQMYYFVFLNNILGESWREL